ncbi:MULTISPECIES: PhoH family protein [unclassified Modestobacter]|uniref:PhoH family protein n=1 Tax=unclassified Modestobacter TaxID=2643866 RepID=UPI0022AA023E|nr:MULTISPECIES: PhoH family protein [unclassified Modestobacter]MCZ2810430.1 PhoH family protein [Modestobacter sp. VKM Ac-2979]MCZ2841916.1 PhoH family protein [Modestobacter sp. VKM Ac-2980]MCZ2847029.1 PhoH family protein [Modestobacter sp. VKM Ac-2978]
MSTRRTYVLDTSVLLSDPGALLRFDEHDVVVPLVVIGELEDKRDHPDLGWFARQTLRMLDDLRVQHGRLDAPLPVGDQGGSLHVELNHSDPSVLPPGFRNDSNDSRIMVVALNLRSEGRDVCLVTKDVPLRVKAAAVGLDTEEYRGLGAVDTGWTGMAELAVEESDVQALYDAGTVYLEAAAELPTHTGLVMLSGRGSALGRVTPDKQVRLVRGDRDAFGLHGRSAEQRVALDLLLDPEIGIVSMGGRAGTGKSALALCAGLESVMERRAHKKVVIFRPLYAVGGQELGYLPGSEGEKMAPWAQAVFDTLGALVSGDVVQEIVARGLIEVLPLTHIRGRSLHDSFVIVDEAQSLERGVLLTVLSRLGTNSRVVLTHDVAQRDNLRVGRHDGVTAVIDRLKGHPLFAHVTLTRSERSPIAALVTEMLEDLPL